MQPSLTPEGEDGHGLQRPECALAHTSGWLIVPCWRGNGGVSFVHPERGITRHVLAERRYGPFDEPLRPNGIALDANGWLLLAHLGDTRGAVLRLHPDGRVDTVVDTVDGAPMPPVNFVVADSTGRLWITVSTRLTPRATDYRRGACTGFIACAEPGSADARLLADGLGYANECVIDEQRERVYVNETFGRRLSAFARRDDATLGPRETLLTFGPGTYPDGLALDVDGGLWVTSIVSNRVLHIDRDRRVVPVIEDSDPAHVDEVEAAWLNDSLGRQHLDRAAGRSLKNVSNLTFGGPDLRTVWLGNLLGDTLPRYRCSVAGARRVHTDAPLTGFIAHLESDR